MLPRVSAAAPSMTSLRGFVSMDISFSCGARGGGAVVLTVRAAVARRTAGLQKHLDRQHAAEDERIVQGADPVDVDVLGDAQLRRVHEGLEVALRVVVRRAVVLVLL